MQVSKCLGVLIAKYLDWNLIYKTYKNFFRAVGITINLIAVNGTPLQ